MSAVAVWITSDEARIFTFTNTGVESKTLHPHGHLHHREVHGKNHPQKGSDVDHFFHQVAQALHATADERWLLLGPGLAKTHFKAHVEEHHKEDAKKIIGVETMDHSTDGEIRNFAHGFFKRQGLFQAI